MAIGALVTMALLLLLMCRHLCRCLTNVVALIACSQAGAIALVVMVLLPSMHRHLYCCCNCDCCLHDNDVVAIDDAQASLPLSRWWHCPHNNDVIAVDVQRRSCPFHNCVVPILKLALLPLLQWCCCHHQCCCPHCSSSSWHHCR
jgi:hypothetical protein